MSFTTKIFLISEGKKLGFFFAFIFLALILYIDSTYTFIGRGDYANYSNVARNLLQGKGFNVDYIAFHYIKYPTITHPEDMWPLLQSVWIAISYFFFGVTPFAARVPNAIFLTLLTILTYLIGKKLFEPKIALGAALLTAFNINLILYSTNWITSDIALAVFFLVIFYLGHQVLTESKQGKVNSKKLFLMGLISGLAIVQKPMGALLPGIYFLFLLYSFRKKFHFFIKPGLILIVSTLIFAGPFFLRNLTLFGTFLLPDEHYMGFLIKYFHYETIFKIFYDHPPSLQIWLDYGLVNFLKVNFQYLRYSIDTFVFKDLLMPYTVIVLSLVGLTRIPGKAKTFIYPPLALFVLMSLLMATYWHYESRYYAMLISVFNLLAAYAFFEIFKKKNWLNITLMGVILFITFLPSTKAILEGVKSKEKDPALTAYEWIRDNTPKEAVIMTLTPWELNFHGERKTITIPYDKKEDILWLGKKYGVDYLELEFLQEVKRPALKALYEGKDTSEFTKIYDQDGKIYVYKINWDKIKLDENSKPKWY